MAELTQNSDPAPHVVLKDRELAALLAWLLPGLGHFYQGRQSKGAIYCGCILGLFVMGLWLGGSREVGWGRTVYLARDRWQYVCQIGVGLPAFPALLQAHRASTNRPVWWGGFMAPPRTSSHPDNPNRNQPSAHELNLKLYYYFELGTVYTMIAGLLNVLAIWDAWGGPVFAPPSQKREDDDQPDEKAPDDNKGGLA